MKGKWVKFNKMVLVSIPHIPYENLGEVAKCLGGVAKCLGGAYKFFAYSHSCCEKLYAP